MHSMTFSNLPSFSNCYLLSYKTLFFLIKLKVVEFIVVCLTLSRHDLLECYTPINTHTCNMDRTKGLLMYGTGSKRKSNRQYKYQTSNNKLKNRIIYQYIGNITML